MDGSENRSNLTVADPNRLVASCRLANKRRRVVKNKAQLVVFVCAVSPENCPPVHKIAVAFQHVAIADV